MRKAILTLAAGLLLSFGASTSTACDGHSKKVTKASTGAEAKVEKKECSTAEKKACATEGKISKTGAQASKSGKSCCATKSGAQATGTEAKVATVKATTPKS